MSKKGQEGKSGFFSWFFKLARNDRPGKVLFVELLPIIFHNWILEKKFDSKRALEESNKTYLKILESRQRLSQYSSVRSNVKSDDSS